MNYDENKMIPTNELSSLLGVVVSVKFLEDVGAKPAIRTKNGAYWLKSEVQNISLAVAGNICGVGAVYALALRAEREKQGRH